MDRKDYDLEIPSSQKEWLEGSSPEEQMRFILGSVLFSNATGDGSRVFTLRKARTYTREELYAILDYMVMSDNVDFIYNSKDQISFGNIQKAIEETLPPQTDEDRAETERSWMRFKAAHPEYYGEVENV